ncbi:RraA family protein [Chelativorans sp. J32]|uniref:RraA family protein n=1 Tax=Chelativorans sp. J32 TaxID=935840 RepID=UPI000481500E|nr:RraA family protein [Chelativorans sp. J32]
MVSLKIKQPSRRVSAGMVDKFREIPAAVVGDCMVRIQAGGAQLRPMHAGGTVLAGPAYTVKTRPGDNLFVHKAIDLAHPGDIIVVDAGGTLDNAIVGEMMLTHAETRGLGGVVIYGAIRDSGHVRNHPFPVYATGVTLRGPFQNGPGYINVPISIAGMVIEPGDLLLGDDDGVICIPYDQVEELYAESYKRYQGENAQRERVRNGTVDRTWIDDRLKAAPYTIEIE